MRRSVQGLIAMILLAAASPAAAEPFLDLYTGKSSTLNSDIRIHQSSQGNDFTVQDASYSDDSFTTPPYYGIRAGYFFEQYPWLGLAIDFFHFKMIANTNETKRFTGTVGGASIDGQQPMHSIVESFEISHGVNYVTATALARYSLLEDPERFPKGRIQLYSGVGLGPIITHAENRVQNILYDDPYRVAGLGVQAFAGVRTLLFKHVGLFAEYRFTHSSLEVSVFSGRANVDENTHHIVGGITFTIPSF